MYDILPFLPRRLAQIRQSPRQPINLRLKRTLQITKLRRRSSFYFPRLDPLVQRLLCEIQLPLHLLPPRPQRIPPLKLYQIRILPNTEIVRLAVAVLHTGAILPAAREDKGPCVFEDAAGLFVVVEGVHGPGLEVDVVFNWVCADRGLAHGELTTACPGEERREGGFVGEHGFEGGRVEQGFQAMRV